MASDTENEATSDKIFYSAGQHGFFHSVLHDAAAIPGDAVEITYDQWQELLNAQSAGKEIVPGANGQPTVRDPAVTAEMLKSRMVTIESQQSRALREAVIGMPGSLDRLKSVDKQITDLRAQIAALK